MTYRITFKGDRKPELVGDDKGKMMYDDWQNGDMPERVEIRVGLTIESKKISDIEHIVDNNVRPTFGHAELKRFETTKLSKYLNEKGELHPWKEIQFLVAEGLIEVVLHSPEYKTDSDATLYIRHNQVAQYSKMMEVLSQWKMYAGAVSYAKKQEAIRLEAMAREQLQN